MDSFELSLTATIHPADASHRAVGGQHESAVVLQLTGSVDASNVAVWCRLLRRAVDATPVPGPLVVDACGLDFMGCCAFAALAGESAACQRRGIRFCLVSDQGVTARAVAASGLQDSLQLYPSVGAALDAGRLSRG